MANLRVLLTPTGAVCRLRAFLEEAGRDPATFPISKRVYIAVDNDERRAERRLQEWFSPVYGTLASTSQVAVWGSAERCVEGLAQVVDAGAQLVLLNPVFDHVEQMERLAKEVMPKL